jgi:hypothetical protein
LKTTQEAQINERFTIAITHLGDKDRLMIRLGGISALEHIAKVSEHHYESVIDILTTFVREQTQIQKTTPPDPLQAHTGPSGQVGQVLSKVPPDIEQSALRADSENISPVLRDWLVAHLRRTCPV